jgi:hypothetical protein
MLKQVGTSGQIALGKQLAGKYFEVSTREDGTIELKPMVVIPESQTWAHTPEMKKRLAESEKWMKANPPRETNIDAFIQTIEAKWAEKAAAKKPAAQTKRPRKAA